MSLQGKRIVVLGGSSGIGLAVAQAAAQGGGAVVVVSSNKARVEAAVASLPNGGEGHAIDLTDEAAVRDLFAGLGEFDHLVYTAAESLSLGPIAETDLTAARKFFELRYWGAYTAAKYGAKSIRPGGSIVFTSGSAGARPRANWSLATSICAGMEGLTRALAVELAPVRVNVVSPGVVRTPLWRDMSEADQEALYKQSAETLLVGHVATPEDIAKTYVYLMDQTYSTGQVAMVDGGWCLI